MNNWNDWKRFKAPPGFLECGGPNKIEFKENFNFDSLTEKQAWRAYKLKTASDKIELFYEIIDEFHKMKDLNQLTAINHIMKKINDIHKFLKYEKHRYLKRSDDCISDAYDSEFNEDLEEPRNWRKRYE